VELVDIRITEGETLKRDFENLLSMFDEDCIIRVAEYYHRSNPYIRHQKRPVRPCPSPSRTRYSEPQNSFLRGPQSSTLSIAIIYLIRAFTVKKKEPKASLYLKSDKKLENSEIFGSQNSQNRPLVQKFAEFSRSVLIALRSQRLAVTQKIQFRYLADTHVTNDIHVTQRNFS